jgi:hypothetical protein
LENEKCFTVLVGKQGRDIPLTISMCSGEDNVKKGLNETGHTNVERIELDQDRFQKNSLERPFY